MSKRDKLLASLKRNLDPAHRSLLKAFTIVEQKDTIVFRMPASFFSLDDLWNEIKSIAQDLKIKVERKDLYATVEELDAILSDIEWLWKGCIPLGFMTLVAGEPGIGKSLFVLDLAKTITKGFAFPNSDEKSRKGSVLWIDTEMKQQLLSVRSKSIGVDRTKLIIPSIGGNLLTKYDASNPEHNQHIVSIIEDKKPLMMVVDSLGHSHSRGENRIEEVRPVMDFMTGLARDYGMAVIVVHHLNKPSKDESTEVSLARVRGSTDIVATPVVIYAIERGADKSVKVRQIKNNIGKPQLPLSAKLVYQDADEEIISGIEYGIYNPPPPKRTKKELCAEWIVSILSNPKNKNGVPLTQLVEEGEGIGFTRGNIYSAREILGDSLTFTGTGKKSIWHLTTAEKDHNSIDKITKKGKGK